MLKRPKHCCKLHDSSFISFGHRPREISLSKKDSFQLKFFQSDELR